jgi:hypothetical protein
MVKALSTYTLAEIGAVFQNCAKAIVEKNATFHNKALIRIHEFENIWRSQISFLDPGVDRDRPDFGVLRTIGYRIGTYGVDPEVRRWLLGLLMNGQIPPVKDLGYVAEWGTPDSPRRYYKLMRTLQNLASNGWRYGWSSASLDWEADRAYVESRYCYLVIS